MPVIKHGRIGKIPREHQGPPVATRKTKPKIHRNHQNRTTTKREKNTKCINFKPKLIEKSIK